MSLNTKTYLEDLRKKIPVYSIYHTLSEEQLKQVKNDLIAVDLLNEAQLKQAQDAISFDYEIEKIGIGEKVTDIVVKDSDKKPIPKAHYYL